jgi:hypothetical protein
MSSRRVVGEATSCFPIATSWDQMEAWDCPRRRSPCSISQLRFHVMLTFIPTALRRGGSPIAESER